MVLPHCSVRFPQLTLKLFYIWSFDLLACILWRTRKMEHCSSWGRALKSCTVHDRYHLTVEITSHGQRSQWGSLYNVTRTYFSDDSFCSCRYWLLFLFLIPTSCLLFALHQPSLLVFLITILAMSSVLRVMFVQYIPYCNGIWFWVMLWWSYIDPHRKSHSTFWAFVTILSPRYHLVVIHDPKCISDVPFACKP